MYFFRSAVFSFRFAAGWFIWLWVSNRGTSVYCWKRSQSHEGSPFLVLMPTGSCLLNFILFQMATKLVINLKKIPYTNRLQRLKVPTLKYRRLRGDMIEVFKMTHNIYDPDVSLKLDNLGCSTRGNKHKLLNCTFCHDLRKYYFSARIINIWNSLPNRALASAPPGTHPPIFWLGDVNGNIPADIITYFRI